MSIKAIHLLLSLQLYFGIRARATYKKNDNPSLSSVAIFFPRYSDAVRFALFLVSQQSLQFFKVPDSK